MNRLAALPALLLPSAALAHAGDHAHSGLLHILTEPDHLAMMALAVAVALVARHLWVRR